MQERKCFGKFIREKRLEKGYSQQQLAEQLFVSESAISKWERGVNYPDITMIADVCKALDISEHELITASNDTEYRQLKKDAGTLRKISKAGFIASVSCYAIALIVCFICNLAINHTLSWFWVVFGSLLCSFSFFPSFARFFSKNKFPYFLLTSAACVIILLVICGIYTASLRWVPVACASVLLGYVLLFLPILMKKYKMKALFRKCKFLIHILLLLVLTIVVLASATILVHFELAKAILLTLYCYAPFIVMGIVFALTTDKWIRAGTGVLFTGTAVYGVNWLTKLFFGSQQDLYAINFSNWESYANGNVMILILAASLLVGVGLLAAGLIYKKTKKEEGDK